MNKGSPVLPWWAPIALAAISQAITAAGVYGAIRSDLREALVRVAIAEKRIDRIEDRQQ